MPIRSHVDPCLFIRFMMIDEQEIPNELRSSLLDRQDSETHFKAWERVARRSAAFHEAYHYWQGLRLPYLHRFAALAYRNVYLAFRELSALIEDHRSWSVRVPELYILEIKGRICFHQDGHLFVCAPEESIPEHVVDHVDLSPLDLLEVATSMVEWQMEAPIESIASVRDFRRWTLRRPAYLAAYRFACRIIGDEEIVLRSLTAVVCAAFHTSNPVRAFAYIIMYLKGNREPLLDASRKAGTPYGWVDLLTKVISNLPYQAPPDDSADLLDPRFFRLTEIWIAGSFGSQGEGAVHPFLTTHALQWKKLADEDKNGCYALAFPRYVFHDAYEIAEKIIYPQLTVVRFSHAGGTRILLFGAENIPFLKSKSIEWNFARDLVTMYSTVRRATDAFFDPDHRLCGHKNCPEYVHNFCNSYLQIPENYIDCKFVENLKTIRKLILQPRKNSDDSTNK